MTTPDDSLVFLTVRGTLVPKTLEAACTLHNQTAGSTEGIAAARALGDLSHKVYAPVPGLGAQVGELLFLDWWKTAEGIGTFFSDPRVHGMASKLFTQREGVVWMPARGAFGFVLPAPMGKAERFLGVVRGVVPTPEQAIEVFRSVLPDGGLRCGDEGFLVPADVSVVLFHAGRVAPEIDSQKLGRRRLARHRNLDEELVRELTASAGFRQLGGKQPSGGVWSEW